MEAYRWLLLAAAQGDRNAKERFSESEKRMTPAQISEGQKRAREFKPETDPKVTAR